MKLPIQFSSPLLVLALLSSPVYGDDLTAGFNKGRQIVSGYKPSSSNGSDRNRDAREERSSQPRPEREPDHSAERRRAERQRREQQREEERQSREREKQRIQDNVREIDHNLALAGNTPPATSSTTSQSQHDANAASARKRQLETLVSTSPSSSLSDKDLALKNAHAVRDAISRGDKPPFKPLWDFYRYNRPVAFGMVPNANRCAIVMSMTLGIQPRPGEISLQQLGNKELVKSLVGPIKAILTEPVKDSDIAARYYANAQQLADRLKNDWGAPAYLDGKKAHEYIAGKQGVIFLKNAYLRRGPTLQPQVPPVTFRTGDHIDLWDSDHIASSSSTPFEKAEKVWFWELR